MKSTSTTKELLKWALDDEIDLLRYFFVKDFWTFFLFGFGAGLNPKGIRWIDEDVHKPLADWLQKHIEDWVEKRDRGEGEQKHLAVLIHREVGKTTMVTQALQAWLHLRDPEISTYTGAESLALASRILNAIKAVFDGSDPYAMFPRLFGNWSTGSRTWTGREVIHGARRNTARKDPSLGTFAVETSIVGAHPDAIFYDDPISYERLETDTNWLATVNSQISSLIPVIQSDGLVIWVGTRYDDDDHFGVAFRDEGVLSVSGMSSDAIPEDPDGKWHVYFMAGRDEDGTPTTPKVWPERRLKDYQRRDPLRYASQVLNDPTVSDFNPLTKDQISQCVVDKEDVPWNNMRYAIMTDTAFSDGGKIGRKDETVLVIHGYPRDGSGDVYVVEVQGSNAWRAEDFAKRLVSTVQRYRLRGHKIFAITDELYPSGGKRGSWELALKNYFADAGEPMPPFHQFSRGGTTKKAAAGSNRLVTAASFWVDGHVRVVKDAPGVGKLMDQMAKIGQYMVNTRIKIDYADAHADAFHEDIYNPMRRRGTSKAPWEPGGRPIEVPGLDQVSFDDDTLRTWRDSVPREPLR